METKEIETMLRKEGASMVGFADLRKTELFGSLGFPFGISIAVALDPDSFEDVNNGPTVKYHHEYERVNSSLDKLSIIGSQYLNEIGYRSKPYKATNEGFVPNVKHTSRGK